MTFYQVFDPGRLCVLNLEGTICRGKGKKRLLIYTIVLATVKSLRCLPAVIVSLLKATVVIPVQFHCQLAPRVARSRS
jgi:hypothetical protein